MSSDEFMPPMPGRSGPPEMAGAPLLPVNADESHPGDRQFCTFALADKWFAVDILCVQEVTKVPEFTTAHHAPPQIAGVVNIRGQIYLCIDLRRTFDLSAAEVDAKSRMILFKPSMGENTAILVDEIGDIVQVGLDHIETRAALRTAIADDVGKIASNLVEGVCKLDDCLLLILDVRSLLQEIETLHS